jgi:hypothetical protein
LAAIPGNGDAIKVNDQDASTRKAVRAVARHRFQPVTFKGNFPPPPTAIQLRLPLQGVRGKVAYG